ncbi:MAG: bis(5'-nucleosyl)-tetraphosphatase (symmetrical) YqeK [Acetatifactor sp.]
MRQLSKAMKKVQDSRRYEHTLGVAYTATALAMRYNAPLKEAQMAGMLHDCAKCLSDEKRLSICEKHRISVTEVERRNPFLLHAKVGAYLAEKKYGVRNQDVLNAIRYHTTGRENMSLLEKIVFVADYIEPGRKQAPNLQEIRQLAFMDIDRAMLRILEDTVHYLNGGSGEIDPATEVTLSFYKTAVENKG